MDCGADALLAAGPTLVLDAATSPLQTGILRGGKWASRSASTDEALESIFGSVAQVLTASGLHLEDLRAMALGIGPGSILGLRLALMALRTWQQLPAGNAWQLYQFHGLTLRARLHQRTASDATAHYLSDFRRGSWHCLRYTEGAWKPLEVARDAGLSLLAGPRYYVPGGRGNQGAPAGATALALGLDELPVLIDESLPWAEHVARPSLYLPDPPTYRAWSPERHRGSA